MSDPLATPDPDRSTVGSRPPADSRLQAAREGWAHAPGRLSPVVVLVIALLSVAAGVGGTLLALRGRGQTAAPAATAGQTSAGGSHGGHSAQPSTPSGAAAAKASGSVYISPARQQTIGVRTEAVKHRALDTTIRTVGTLAYDETRVREIHTKIAGWVERVYVDYVGKPVRRGQPLLTIYSPDLVATQNEYLLALKAQRQLAASAFEDTRSGAASLVSSARDRLRLWDVTDAQVAELERTGQATRILTLYSPFNGIVLERTTFAGQYLTPETSSVKIADLSNIWVIGQIFEYELRYVRLGQTVQIEFPYAQSSRQLTGRITFIYPDVDPQTRRARVRIEFRNPGLELKPQTYVTVRLNISGGRQLALPKEALIDTGDKRYTIVARENGYFEPRQVEVGEPVDQYYPVVNGLEMGERVVTSAQFLIDSETNLQAAMKAMSATMPGMDMGDDMEGMDMGEQPGAPAHEGGHGTQEHKDMPGMDGSTSAPPKKPEHPRR